MHSPSGFPRIVRERIRRSSRNLVYLTVQQFYIFPEFFKGNNPPSSFFSKTLLIVFTIQFFILLSETLNISQTKSWVSQNNIRQQTLNNNRQSHSSCCELIGHRRATDEAVPADWLRIYQPAPNPFVVNSNFPRGEWVQPGGLTFQVVFNMDYNMAISV